MFKCIRESSQEGQPTAAFSYPSDNKDMHLLIQVGSTVKNIYIWLFEHRVYNAQYGLKDINYFDFSAGFVST